MLKPIIVIDTFAGIGGFTEGAIQAGAKVVLAIDSWDKANAVHLANHPDVEVVRLEMGTFVDELIIREVMKKYPNHWIHLHGSPPCQAISNASNRDPSEGMPLVFHFLELVERLKPDSWSMENVEPLNKRLPDHIPRVIINSADFGVPQIRRRCIAGSGWVVSPTHSPDNYVGICEVLPAFPDPSLLMDSGRASAKTTGINPRTGKKEGGSGPLFRTLDKPSYTIMRSPKYICRPAHPKPERIRAITVEEMLILQGFDSSYDVSAARTLTDQRIMVGNAVCPAVAKAIIEGIQQ